MVQGNLEKSTITVINLCKSFHHPFFPFYIYVVHPLLSLCAPVSHHDSQGHLADTTVLLEFLPYGVTK